MISQTVHPGLNRDNDEHSSYMITLDTLEQSEASIYVIWITIINHMRYNWSLVEAAIIVVKTVLKL